LTLNNRNISIYVSLTIVLMFATLLVWQWLRLSGVLRVTLFGIVFAYLLSPISHRLEKLMPRAVALALLVILVLVLVIIILSVFIPALIRQVMDLSEQMPQLTSELRDFIADTHKNFKKAGLPYGIEKALDEMVVDAGRKLSLSIGQSMDKVVEFAGRLPEIFISPVLGFYFLKDEKHFKNAVIRLIPQNHRKMILRTLSEMHIMLSRFIRGQLTIGFIIGLLSTLGFWAIGLPYALVLGFVSGIFEMIPYFGPWLGAIPAVIVALLNEPSRVLWTIILILGIQQLEGSVIAPKIMGDHVGLHPVYIILSLWIGGIYFGVLGMLLSVPVVLILRVIFKNIFLSIVSERW